MPTGRTPSNIVRVATAGDAAIAWESALPCWCRRPTPTGQVEQRLRYGASRDTLIRRQCGVCGDEGVISNWEELPFDLRRRRLALPAPSTRSSSAPRSPHAAGEAQVPRHRSRANGIRYPSPQRSRPPRRRHRQRPRRADRGPWQPRPATSPAAAVNSDSMPHSTPPRRRQTPDGSGPVPMALATTHPAPVHRARWSQLQPSPRGQFRLTEIEQAAAASNRPGPRPARATCRHSPMPVPGLPAVSPTNLKREEVLDLRVAIASVAFFGVALSPDAPPTGCAC